MSIPLINEVNKNDINTSIIAIKKDLERINTLLGLNNTEEIDTSIFATKEELEQAKTDLAPVDTVTSGNMHSVTSNAVYNALIRKIGMIISQPELVRTFDLNTVGLADGSYLLFVKDWYSSWNAFELGVLNCFRGEFIYWKISGNMNLVITDGHTLSCDGYWWLYRICFIPLELPV